MSSRGALGVLAGIMLLAGVFFGFSSHSVSTATVGPVNCGSAFSSSSKLDTGVADIQAQIAGDSVSFESQCSDALSAPRTISFVLMGVGVLVGLFCLLTAMGAQPKRESPTPVQETLS